LLKSEIEEVRRAIQAGQFPNEAAVSQGVVLRLFAALGWPTYNTQIVAPEFALQGRRVDFALCHPPGKPLVFIEVKQVGQSDGAERQLFEYAFHKGVPMAILTDGREWHFFLPGEAGDYGERRVYKLDIVERSAEESANRFEHYLDHDAVCSGAALKAARADYEDVTRERQIQAALPGAWSGLIAEEDELLIELVTDKVESLCGYKPDPDTVATFLKQVAGLSSAPTPPPPAVRRVPATPTTPSGISPVVDTSSIGFVLLGEKHAARNARDVLITAMEALAARDPSFLDRFAALPKHGRTRRYVARDRADLYPGRPDLAQEHAHQLRSGWWLGTNLSRRAVERILEMACGVAGLSYGSELVVQLGD